MLTSDPKPPRCVACQAPLGDVYGELPVYADGSHGHEPWCPQCFVHKRTKLETDRWHRPFAVACARCRMKTVAFGRAQCGQCGKLGQPLLLPPKPSEDSAP